MPFDAKKQEIVIDEGDRYVAVFDPLDGSSNVDAGIQLVQSLVSMNTTRLARSTRIALEKNAPNKKPNAWPTPSNLELTW